MTFLSICYMFISNIKYKFYCIIYPIKKINMEFQDFETLYEAACQIVHAAGHNAVIASAAKKQQKLLLSRLYMNFPSSLKEANAHSHFNLVQFMEMLVKFPEIIRLNETKFISLIDDIENQGLKVFPELKRVKNNLKTIHEDRKNQDTEIKKRLISDFPDCMERLEAIPFAQKDILNCMINYPDILEANRQQFLQLMVNMSSRLEDIPEELKIIWRSLVLQP